MKTCGARLFSQRCTKPAGHDDICVMRVPDPAAPSADYEEAGERLARKLGNPMPALDETVAATDADVAVATAIVSHLRGYGVKLPGQAHFAVQAVARHAQDAARRALGTLESFGDKFRNLPDFLPMESWDSRNDAVLLLVDYGTDDAQHAIDDAAVAITIGHNNDHNVGAGEGQGWQFAGWCWSHDHYTQGVGKVIGWLPLSGFHVAARAVEAVMYPHTVVA